MCQANALPHIPQQTVKETANNEDNSALEQNPTVLISSDEAAIFKTDHQKRKRFLSTSNK